jgi:hypothetical protein
MTRWRCVGRTADSDSELGRFDVLAVAVVIGGSRAWRRRRRCVSECEGRAVERRPEQLVVRQP